MKLLNLPILFVLSIRMLAAPTISSAPTTEHLRTFAPRAGRQRTALAGHLRKAGSASGTSPRPMATTPILTLPPAPPTPGFQTAPHFSTGTTLGGSTTPIVTALCNFHGGGSQDIAAVVQDVDSNFWLSILLSNGDGRFQDPVLTPITFAQNDFMAAADLNAGSNCDVVLVHSNSVDVLMGDGAGGFAAAVNYPDSIPVPAAVGLVDTNADGFFDIVVANATIDTIPNSPVALLVNDSTGFFGTEVFISHYAGTMDYGVIADVNADGFPDLVGATQVFFGTGGDYAAPIPLIGSTPSTCGAAQGSVVVAKLTPTGSLPDIVTADCLAGTITAFMNLGSKTFASGVSTRAGYRPQNLAVANFNEGTNPDVIVSDFYSMDLMILLGHGDGTFTTAPVGYPVGGSLWTTPLVADFGGLGNQDVVTTTGIPDQGSSLVYLAGLGDGTLVAPHDYYYAGGTLGKVDDSYGIATADLNGDGLPDFVVGNLSDDTAVGVTVFLSNLVTGHLDLGVNYGNGGNLEFVALADVDGDGNADLIASSLSGGLLVFLGTGTGTGTFQTTPVTKSVTTSAGLGQLVIGKFNADTKPDIAVLDSIGNVWVLLNTTSTAGSPTFAAAPYALTSTSWEIATADLGNGHLDLVITQAQSTSVSILLGNGAGTFAPQTDFDLGSMYPAGLTIAQLSPAGHQDLIVSIDDSNAGMGIAVASGAGDGTFATPVLYPATSKTTGNITPFPAEVRVADLNGDGNLDLVFTNAGDGTVGVLYGTGVWDGTSSPFYAPLEFAANDYPPALLLADVNGDGAFDAVIGSFNFSGVTILLNTGANSVALSSGPGPAVNRGPKQASRSAIPHDAPGTFTFTAVITPLTLPGAPVNDPSGMVTFTDGVSPLGSISVSGGTASITPDLSVPGTHIITAIYSGDKNFIGGTKATSVRVIDPPASNYTLSAAPPTDVTLSPGRSHAFTITATPTSSSTDTVNFSCPSLPQGISCTFSSPSIILAGLLAQSITLTISVSPTFVASAAPVSRPSLALPLASATIGMFAWFLLGSCRRPVRSKWMAALALIVLATILASVGCGESNNNMSTPPTSKVIRVMATTQGESSVHEINILITIRP